MIPVQPCPSLQNDMSEPAFENVTGTSSSTIRPGDIIANVLLTLKFHDFILLWDGDEF